MSVLHYVAQARVGVLGPMAGALHGARCNRSSEVRGFLVFLLAASVMSSARSNSLVTFCPVTLLVNISGAKV